MNLEFINEALSKMLLMENWLLFAACGMLFLNKNEQLFMSALVMVSVVTFAFSLAIFAGMMLRDGYTKEGTVCLVLYFVWALYLFIMIGPWCKLLRNFSKH